MGAKDVTVGDALKKVTELSMEISDQGEFEAVQNAQEDDTLVLHRAAGIIRKAIAGLLFQTNEYALCGEIEIDKCKAFVPDILLDFVSWCTSKHRFENALGCSEGVSEAGDLLKILAICYNIIGLSCSIPTSISFSLGVQMLGSC